MGMLVGWGGLPVGDDRGTGVPLLHRGGPVVGWLVGPDGDAVAARCGVCRPGGPWHEAGAGAVAPGLSVDPRC